MKILVTGSAGFIGFHLAKRLLDEGHEVVGIDNFNSYYAVVLKRNRHAILEKYENYHGIQGDLADHVFLRELFERQQFPVVCHLAAQPGVRYSLTHPFEYQKSNLEAFLSVLEACRHGKVKRLVYASSSSVYGNSKKLPFSEKDPVDHPISLYAATKKANELMAHTYTHLYGFQTVGLRFFTVYGPWGRPDMATWLFADAISQGKPISVFNYGKMQRDFTYVDDIVSGVQASLFAQGLDSYELFNIGNHRSESLMDMISEMGRNFGVEPQMDLKPMQPGDVPATYADIEMAERKIGFKPTTPMKDGIALFVDWFKANGELVEAVRSRR